MASNPRIDDLRKRLEKEPGSRLFAQLAEELRKEGELEEAVRICREGLQKHPAYPSARITLGRALFDTGDLAAARGEFESVLKGAPDNILASRLLGESLEGLGELKAAADRYQATLALAPGDKAILDRLQGLEGKPKRTAAVGPAAGAPATSAFTAAASARGAEPARIPLSAADGDFVLEPASAAPATVIGSAAGRAVAVPPVAPVPEGTSGAGIAAGPAADREGAAVPAEGPADEDLKPIPLVAADESFELERPNEPPPPPPPAAAPAASAPSVAAPAMAVPEPIEEFDFESREPLESTLPFTAREGILAMGEAPVAPPPPSPAASPAHVPPSAGAPWETAAEAAERAETPPEAPPPAGEAEILSPTLAELYFNQGFTEKAIDVYRRILEREPGHGRVRARLQELEALDRHVLAEGGGPPAVVSAHSTLDPRAVRRLALERTISRLEGLLATIRRE